MNILQIIPYMDSKYGGPVYVAKSMHKFFSKHDFSSTILSLGEIKSDNENIIILKKSTEKWFFSFDYLFNAHKCIKKNDILILHGFYAFIILWSTILAVLFNKKIYLRPAGMLDKDSVFSSGLLQNVFRYIYIYSIGLLPILVSKNIIFNSEKEKRNSFFSFLQKSIVIPNGVDFDYIDAIDCQKKMFNSNKINLFFLGRINKIKGIEILLDAVVKLKGVELTVAGSGNSTFVERLKKKYTKNIHYIGHIDGDKKYCYLKQCDIYVQPSKTEGLSLAMLEAMACNVAMITTNKVGLYEELQEKNAAKIISYDQGELQKAISDLIRDQSRREMYAKKAFNLIKNKYNWDLVIDSYIKLMGDNK